MKAPRPNDVPADQVSGTVRAEGSAREWPAAFTPVHEPIRGIPTEAEVQLPTGVTDPDHGSAALAWKSRRLGPDHLDVQWRGTISWIQVSTEPVHPALYRATFTDRGRDGRRVTVGRGLEKRERAVVAAPPRRALFLR